MKTLNTSLPQLVNISGEPDCCNDTSSYRFCFYYNREPKHVLAKTATLKRRDLLESQHISVNVPTSQRRHACLPARHAMSRPFCRKKSDCRREMGQDMLCLKPLTSNQTHVIKIAHKKGRPVLFVGHPNEISSSLSLSNYVPKFFFCPMNLPGHLFSISMYTISVSAALAVLNMVPCYSLDGHFVLIGLVETCLPALVRGRSSRQFITSFILFWGTLLLLVNIVIALWKLAIT